MSGGLRRGCLVAEGWAALLNLVSFVLRVSSANVIVAVKLGHHKEIVMMKGHISALTWMAVGSCATLAAFVLGGTGRADEEPAKFDVVQVSRLELLRDNGEVAGVLETTGFGSSLTLRDDKGRSVMQVAATGTGGLVDVGHRDGQVRAMLMALPGESVGLSFLKEMGTSHTLAIAGGKESGSMSIFDKDGKAVKKLP